MIILCLCGILFGTLLVSVCGSKLQKEVDRSLGVMSSDTRTECAKIILDERKKK